MTNWALKNFNDWVTNRNRFGDPVPQDLLQATDPKILSNHLSRFIVETRKSNGKPYPPSILYQLLFGLLRHMRDNNPLCPNFLKKKDPRFKLLHNTLDAYFNKLHSDGIGRKTKHAEVISVEEETQLWDSGVMDIKLLPLVCKTQP